MPIALLKFPYDLLGEVLKLCDPFELYFLSKCSKRAQKTIKLGGKMNWKIRYWGREQIIICRDDVKYYIFDPTDKPEDYFKMGSAKGDKSMKIPKEEAVDMFFYLLDTFGICVVNSLEVQSGNLYNFLQITKVLAERNMEIEKFYIGETFDPKYVINFMPLIDQMNITKELHCRNSFPPNFDYQFDKYPNSIRISDSPWFGINQLLNCPCTRIELSKSELSNQELNLFFQEWKKAGTFPNLRYLQVSSKNIDNQSAIWDMVPPITRRENPRIRFSAWLGEDDYIFMRDAVKVYKDDGTEAWLDVDLGGVPSLEFLVWDPERDMFEGEDMDPSDDEEEFEDEEFEDEESDEEESDDEEPDEDN
ncbi:hypothetical protein B9Z55_003701 [Caenorhabditis nigoni]|uniref:F-box domain-containing protein n=1 Tax=Caenorhabditis nigoni TaxID=1611254 RepID=A0A2G5VSA7_9PELO|nr:hypothetical protein B9Z55_003701 [Caenorhabditis nigoni]